ncbi:MAG: molybdopterin-dependent oxidoreductase, partial [Coriobacteriales bacterium]|nr:molybdopterin-dependent oxidoreductase [Coriobacteriales bacterium]
MTMSSEWKTELEDGSVVVRTCGWSPPGDHPVGCGMKLTIKDGKLIHVEGDEEHSITGGRLCPRCLALKDVVYHPDRVLYPMKRDPKDRGKDKWEKITWDEAYDMIVEKVTDIKAKFGAESIVVYGGTGREACLYYYPLAFAVLQTPNCCYTQSGWSCYGPRCSVSEFIFGAGYPEIDYAGFFADRFDNPDFELPKIVVCWGKHPLQSNGDGIFGHALVDMMKLGTKIIMVDPRITWLGSRDGNMTVQIKPGTDAALALAVVNIMIQEGTYDHEFVDYWCYGFEELKARAAEYTVEKVSEITWVPEEEILEFAHILGDPANRPASIAWGLAVDQNSNGVQVAQLIIIIQALMGVIDVPGGLTIGPTKSMLGSWRMDGIEELAANGLWDKRIGSHKWLGLAAGMATTSPDETLVTAETGEPYELHMAWFNSTNFLAPTCSSQPQRWYKALLKMDFNVVQDLFMTPTAMGLADLFLPLPTFAEHDGIVLPHYGRNTVFMGAMNEAFRVGDTRSDIEVLIELGKRLNPKAWQFDDVEDFFTKQCEELGFTFDELRHMGLYQPGYTYRKYEKGL